MDFEPRYTAERQSFREEVRGWLEENLPPDLARRLGIGRQIREQAGRLA